MTGYIITYTAQGGSVNIVEVDVVNTFTLTSLKKYTSYRIYLSVKNHKFVGPQSDSVYTSTFEDGKVYVLHQLNTDM